jgi:hypothetical protein
MSAIENGIITGDKDEIKNLKSYLETLNSICEIELKKKGRY